MVSANASQEHSGKWTNYFGKVSRFCDTIGVGNFQAHGWLFIWKNRFDIKFKDVVGEGNQVTPELGYIRQRFFTQCHVINIEIFTFCQNPVNSNFP